MTTVHGASVSMPRWRSIDWRFLLPPGPLESVGYFGDVPTAEREVLEDSGVRVVQDPERDSDLDVVIVTDDLSGGLVRAVDAVRPGGWVMLRLGTLRRLPWSRLRQGSVRIWAKRAQQNRLVATAAYWQARNARNCSYMVEVHDRRAVDTMLKRYHESRFGLIESLVARFVHRVGLLELIARDIILVGQRDTEEHAGLRGGAGRRPPLLPLEVEGTLLNGRTPLSRLLVTPRMPTSRHVLCLYIDPVTNDLCGVAKMPRRTWDVDGIHRESETLRALARRTENLQAQVPTVHGLALETRPFLLESAVMGKTVIPRMVRADPDSFLTAALHFVLDLPVTGRTRTEPSWFSALIEEPLRELSRRVPLEVVPPLVEQSLELLEPLRRSDLPLVMAHGDLRQPNLLLTTDGRLAALDWERSEQKALPGSDFMIFLQYVSEALQDTLNERRGQVQAFDRAFLGADAWARPWLTRYVSALGLDDGCLPALFLATWARAAAGLLTRLLPSGEWQAEGVEVSSQLTAELAATLAHDREFTFWQQAVRRFNDFVV